MDNRTEILLANPYHDKLGRFASKLKAAGTKALPSERTRKNLAKGAAQAAVGQVGWLGFKGIMGGIRKPSDIKPGLVLSAYTVLTGAMDVSYGVAMRADSKRLLKSYKARGGTNASYIRRREGVTDRAEMHIGKGVAKMAFGGFFLALSIKSGEWTRANQSWDYFKRETYRGYSQGYNYRRGPRPRYERSRWPSGATEDKFKDMYRNLSKRYHPDVGGDPEIMKKINIAKDNMDWKTMADLYKNLSEWLYTIDLSEDQLKQASEALAVMYRMFKDILKDGCQYATLPNFEGNDIFPVEDGKIVLNRAFIKFFVNIFEAWNDNGNKSRNTAKQPVSR